MQLATRQEFIRGVLAIAALCHSAACIDTVEPNDTSSGIGIRTTVAGFLPAERFVVQVDNLEPFLLAHSTSSVVRVAPGTHHVTLLSLPPNCKVEGANPKIVVTEYAGIVAADFSVTCVSTTGALSIDVSVSGFGGVVWLFAQVDSAAPIPLRGNLSTVVGPLSGGSHSVNLRSIPPFCRAQENSGVNVVVKTGRLTTDTAVASFHLICEVKLAGDTVASIAFQREGHVALISQDGLRSTFLTRGYAPDWSPNREFIVFERFECPNEFSCHGDLWRINPDGTGERPIIVDENFSDRDAAVSPDARSIAFIRFWLGPDQHYLVVSDLDGKSLRILAIWNAGAAPAWSPDGKQIAFSCQPEDRKGGLDLCIVDSRGGCADYFTDECDLPAPVRLVSTLGNKLDPAWSPDGGFIAFTRACSPSLCGKSDYILEVVDVQTRVVTSLGRGFNPAWSPDGTRIIFSRNSEGGGLFIHSLSDGSLTQLTDQQNDAAPSWR